MRLDRLATLYLARPLRALAPLPGAGCVRILMYHRISDDTESGVGPYYRLNTSPARFAEQMQLLKDHGYRVLDLVEALDQLKAGRTVENSVAITFDDGYADFAEHAFPILRKYRFAATVFLPTTFISDVARPFRNSDCLTWSQVRDLRGYGIRFGSHTVSHPKLHELSWSAIDEELSASRKVLEDRLQEPITTFAHPYAFPEADRPYVKEFTARLKQHGYQCCATTRIGVAAAHDDPYSLKRLPVNGCDDLLLFSAKLAGAYDWVAWPQRLQKHAKSARHKSKQYPVESTTAPSPSAAGS